MSLRDQRQEEFAEVWWNTGAYGIINACPRFGKIRTAIHALRKHFPLDCSLLVAYPDNKIKTSWLDECKLLGYKNPHITYTTHLSLHKYQAFKFDVIILDEIHLLSEAQLSVARDLILCNGNIMGLTGTLSKWTEDVIGRMLDLVVVARYPMELAIKEGVLTDYEITVFKVPLDTLFKSLVKTKWLTEKQRYNNITWVIEKLEAEKKNAMFLKLARMRIVQSSVAKLIKTKELLLLHPNDRVLVFCGITRIADSLGIPAYHSKSIEKETFQKFAEGEIDHLAVVKIGATGITYKPLNRVIINYFSSSEEDLVQRVARCMSMEFGNPDKKAYISIISTDEEIELRWLRKALSLLDETKIKYL